MESTGVKDRIQLSNETAQFLIGAGKEDWLVERAEKVVAKGMITYPHIASTRPHVKFVTRQREVENLFPQKEFRGQRS